jgi:4-hydroxy-L-threonine phosphate dehydrogenase PdxA
MKAGGLHHEDELHFFADLLDFKLWRSTHTRERPSRDPQRLTHDPMMMQGFCCELSVLDGLMTSRVTSHVPLRAVADLLTPASVCNGIVLLTDALRAAGKAEPRILVCGLNPHAGDSGTIGDDEIRTIK